MKKQLLALAFATALLAGVATGCSSKEKATGSDTTSMDSTNGTMSAPTTTPTDTTARDTMRRDTSRANPQ